MATAVLCRLGAAREYQKMAANRKPKVGAARRSGPKTQARSAVALGGLGLANQRLARGRRARRPLCKVEIVDHHRL